METIYLVKITGENFKFQRIHNRDGFRVIYIFLYFLWTYHIRGLKQIYQVYNNWFSLVNFLFSHINLVVNY